MSKIAAKKCMKSKGERDRDKELAKIKLAYTTTCKLYKFYFQKDLDMTFEEYCEIAMKENQKENQHEL